MVLVDPDLSGKLVFYLGIVNILGVFFVLLSCRCLLGKNFSWLNKKQWFILLYRHHCKIWWIFLVSVVLHAVLAVDLYGVIV